jgi:hypothetical protein
VSTHYWVKGKVRAADIVDGLLVTQNARKLVERLKVVESHLELVRAADDVGPVALAACERARRRDALRGRRNRERTYRSVDHGRRRCAVQNSRTRVKGDSSGNPRD